MTMTIKQSQPVTDAVRPIADLLQQAKEACDAAGVPGTVYVGTSYRDLAKTIPTAMTTSAGRPCAIVCYGGSVYGKKPRRTSAIVILVLQGHTKASPGVATAISAAEAIVASLDDVIYQDTDGEYPITDKWAVAEDEVVDLDGLESAACIMLTFNVEDY